MYLVLNVWTILVWFFYSLSLKWRASKATSSASIGPNVCCGDPCRDGCADGGADGCADGVFAKRLLWSRFGTNPMKKTELRRRPRAPIGMRLVFKLLTVCRRSTILDGCRIKAFSSWILCMMTNFGLKVIFSRLMNSAKLRVTVKKDWKWNINYNDISKDFSTLFEFTVDFLGMHNLGSRKVDVFLQIFNNHLGEFFACLARCYDLAWIHRPFAEKLNLATNISATCKLNKE